MSDASKNNVIFLDICLRSIPIDPDVVSPSVRSNVENSDSVTEWQSVYVTGSFADD